MDMDELKIKTKLMRGMLAKIIEMMINKKTGYKVKIQLNDIDVSITEDIAHIHLDVDGDVNANDLKKFSRIIGLEE